jgi:hypothetical protein
MFHNSSRSNVSESDHNVAMTAGFDHLGRRPFEKWPLSFEG